MENVLRIEKILDFCDVPQLFVARDAFDTLYLCLLYEDELLCRYTGIRISARRLEDFLSGGIDLRSLFIHPENKHEYFDVVFQTCNINTRGSWRNRCLKINCLLRDIYCQEICVRMW